MAYDVNELTIGVLYCGDRLYMWLMFVFFVQGEVVH